MCNRYVSPDQAAIERYWQVVGGDPWRSAAEIFPRAAGPFIRVAAAENDRQHESGHASAPERELVVGQWGLIPWFAKEAQLSYSTNNARFEEIATKASYKQSWARGKRCIIPAWSFDEPCWESGRNVWWRFRRADGMPWGLAGLWNTWVDKTTGEICESYTMLTVNADLHPLMARMHKPDPKLPPDQQDKRSVVPIDLADVDAWLCGSNEEAASLVRVPPVEVFDATPLAKPATQSKP